MSVLRCLLTACALFFVSYMTVCVPSVKAEEDQEIQQAPAKKTGVYGIGVKVDCRGGKIVVVRSMDGSPARKAGIMPGDVLTAVDGRSLLPAKSADDADILTGDKGAPVTVSVLHKGAEVAIVHHLKRDYRWH